MEAAEHLVGVLTGRSAGRARSLRTQLRHVDLAVDTDERLRERQTVHVLHHVLSTSLAA